MKFVFKIVTLLLLLIVAAPAFAQENSPVAFTVEEAVAYALKNTAEMKNVELDKQYANKDVKETLAGGFPQVNGNINFTNYLGIPVNIIQVPNPQTGELQQQEFKFGTDYTLSAKVNVTQMLFDANFFVGLKASRLYVDLMDRSIEQTEAETKNKVTKAYYSALISEENLDILDQNLANVEKMLYETEQMYKTGFVEQIEVDRLSLSRNNIITQIQNLERQKNMLYALLKFQMGMNVNDSLVLTEKLASLETDAALLLSEDMDVKNMPEYDIINLQKELTGLSIKNIRSMYYPKANLFGAYEKNAQRDDFSFFDFEKEWYTAAYWGVGIQIPIFDSFKKSYQIQQEQINYQKLDNLQTQVKNSLYLQLSQARTEYLNALDQLENQKKNLELANKIFNTATIKYNQGVGSSLEVNNAETTLYQTQSSYINALYNLLIAKSDLTKALGLY